MESRKNLPDNNFIIFEGRFRRDIEKLDRIFLWIYFQGAEIEMGTRSESCFFFQLSVVFHGSRTRARRKTIACSREGFVARGERARCGW